MDRVPQHGGAGPADPGFVELAALVTHRADPGLAAEGVGGGIDGALPAQFAQPPRGELLARPGQRAEDVVVGMHGESFGAAAAVFLEWGFEGLQHFDQAGGQEALGVGTAALADRSLARAKRSSRAGAVSVRHKRWGVPELFPLAFASILQGQRRGQLLDQRPGEGLGPVLEDFERGGIILA